MNRIKFLREEQGIFQKDLAKLLNVSVPAINYYENEKRSIDTNTAYILAVFFNVSIDYLLGKSDIRNPENEKLNTNCNELLRYYNKLNNIGKEKAVEYLSDLSETPKYTDKKIESKEA